MSEIKRFGVGSVAKILGMIYAVIGFIIGALFTLITILGLFAASGDAVTYSFFGGIFGLAAIVFFPIFYGIIGVIVGAITAIVYNFAAGMVGGIRIDLRT